MKLAFHIGGTGRWYQRLFDWAVRRVTGSPFSHVELVINGESWSSSLRDGGVRCKRIQFDPAHWVVIDIPGDQDYAHRWFLCHVGKPYDLLGLVRFVVPFPRSARSWFCSEAVAAALKHKAPEKYSPGDLHKFYAIRSDQ